MSKELGIIVIHGMGSQGEEFAQKMIDEINYLVNDDHDKDSAKIAWKPVHWADILEPRELDYLKEARKENDLDFIGLRKFVLTKLGDAVAYQQIKGRNNTNKTYEEIHSRVKDDIKGLYTNGLQSNNKPLVVIAHSLGAAIMSNYIYYCSLKTCFLSKFFLLFSRAAALFGRGPLAALWDIQKEIADTAGMSSFKKMDTLSGMIAFGCNLPLFTFAYDPVEAIKFPSDNLPDDLKQKAKCHNYFDRNDILGYPLKAISPSYINVVSEDIEINVGNIFSSWNPMSHIKYWTGNDFTKPVSKLISEFL